jgi:polysaccharide biosynthesis transport protein
MTGADFRRTKVSGLWLMPAGHAPQSPADLLGSPRFSRLIEDLRKQFDWVVVDSPPVLVVTDPCLIARAVSAVLLVVDSSRMSREVVAATIDRLDSVGAPLVGAMLNNVKFDRNESYLPYYHRPYNSDDPPRQDDGPPPELPEIGSDERNAPGPLLRG